MDIKAIIRSTSHAMESIALERGLTLFVPVRTVVSICATLPRSVIGTAIMCMKTPSAAIEVLSPRFRNASEFLPAIDTGLSDRLTDMVSICGSPVLGPARTRTKTLERVGKKPARGIASYKSLAAKLASTLNSLAFSTAGFIHALARTVNPAAGTTVIKLNPADRADMCGHCYTSDSMLRDSTVGRASRIKRLSAISWITLAR